MTSLAHPEIPAKVIEALIKWEQPTPAQYARVAPAPILEILSNLEEEPEEKPEEDPEEPTPASSSRASGSGPSRLLESGSESSHQFMLEWMADRHRQWRADRTDRPSLIDVHCSASASTPSVRTLALESNGVGPSGIAIVVISSDSSLEEDSDSSDLDTSSSEEDQ